MYFPMHPDLMRLERKCIFKCWRQRERSGKLCACARAAAHWEDVSFGDILSHEACGESHRSAAYDLIGDPPYQVLPYPSNPTLYFKHPTLPALSWWQYFWRSLKFWSLPPLHPPTLAHITEAFRAWKLQCIIHFTLWWVVLHICSEVQIRSL